MGHIKRSPRFCAYFCSVLFLNNAKLSFDQEGREDARPARCNTSAIDENVEDVKKIDFGNRRVTIRLAEDVCISTGLCHSIFSGVSGVKHEAAKFVSKSLNFD